MTNLPIRTETVHFVDYQDLNKFVNEVYDFQPTTPFPGSDWQYWPYDFVSTEEASNYSDYTFNVEGLEHSDEITTWLETNGKSDISTYEIFDNLCFRGFIQPGTYVVKVFW